MRIIDNYLISGEKVQEQVLKEKERQPKDIVTIEERGRGLYRVAVIKAGSVSKKEYKEIEKFIR